MWVIEFQCFQIFLVFFGSSIYQYLATRVVSQFSLNGIGVFNTNEIILSLFYCSLLHIIRKFLYLVLCHGNSVIFTIAFLTLFVK